MTAGLFTTPVTAVAEGVDPPNMSCMKNDNTVGSPTAVPVVSGAVVETAPGAIGAVVEILSAAAGVVVDTASAPSPADVVVDIAPATTPVVGAVGGYSRVR